MALYLRVQAVDKNILVESYTHDVVARTYSEVRVQITVFIARHPRTLIISSERSEVPVIAISFWPPAPHKNAPPGGGSGGHKH